MEASQCADHRFPGTQMQMVGIAQHDLSSRALDFDRVKPANSPVSAHRHERRRAHRPMRQRERAGTGEIVCVVQGEREHWPGKVVSTEYLVPST